MQVTEDTIRRQKERGIVMSGFKESLRKMTKQAGEIMDKNGSTIFTWGGIALFGASMIFTFIAAKKTEEVLEELDAEIAYDCEHEHKEPPSKTELALKRAKKLAPVVAPSIVTFALGTVCELKARNKDAETIASVTAAFEASEFAKRRYKDFIRNQVGEKEYEKLEYKLQEEKSREVMPEDEKSIDIAQSGHGDQLFFDVGSQRFFRASTNWLERCREQISHNIFTDGYASANELEWLFGLTPSMFGNKLGWSYDDLDDQTKKIDMKWTKCYMAPWGETYAAVEYEVHERFKE